MLCGNVRCTLVCVTPDSEVVVVKSLVLEAPGSLVLREASEPDAPGPGEALVRVLRVGICGTDLHAYRGVQAFMRYPIILGHELSVELLELGPTAANGLRVGDRCTVLPYLADGTCPACRAGRTNCCVALELLGVHVDGGMRERFIVPAAQLIAANDLDPEVLALVEMLAVGAHAVRRGAVTTADRVLVLGAGPIGLSVMAFARRRAAEVFALDIDPVRASFAEAVGLARSIVVTPDVTAAAEATPLMQAVRTAFGGALPDVVFDATGHRGSMERAPDLVEHGGRLVFVGHTAGSLTFDNPTLHRKELTLVCSRNATRVDFDEVLSALRGFEVDVGRWITTRTSVERLVDDLPAWTRSGAGVIKAVAAWPATASDAHPARKQERA